MLCDCDDDCIKLYAYFLKFLERWQKYLSSIQLMNTSPSMTGLLVTNIVRYWKICMNCDFANLYLVFFYLYRHNSIISALNSFHVVAWLKLWMSAVLLKLYSHMTVQLCFRGFHCCSRNMSLIHPRQVLTGFLPQYTFQMFVSV